MSGFLTLLWLVTIAFLVWGLLAPAKLSSKIRKSGDKQLTRRHFSLGFGPIAVILLLLIGVTAPPQPASKNVGATKPVVVSQATKTVTKASTSTKPVPFSSSTVQDPSLAKGTSSVTTTGVDGVETLSYQDTYTNGKLTSHKLVSDTITTKPVTQVTTVGTYVAPAPTQPTGCTNGTYVNSAGNTVCSPETSPSAPAGATAQCADGTYSFSQSRSGTCSHHGGVAQWL